MTSLSIVQSWSTRKTNFVNGFIYLFIVFSKAYQFALKISYK